MNKEINRTLARESFELQEAGYDSSKGVLTVTVIKPGFSLNKTKGRQRYYPAATLKRDHQMFAGSKMFADHQTENESKQRPEGSVHNWVANLGEVWAEPDGTVKGRAIVIDPTFKSKLDKLSEQKLLKEMKVSVRIAALTSPDTVDGRESARIDEIVAARSVDFVTVAGAGGQVEAMESDQNDPWDVDVISEEELRKRRPDLIELIESSIQGEKEHMKTLEVQLQESQTELTAKTAELKAANDKLAEAEKTAKKATAQTEIVKMLSESKLPEKAQERLKKQFAEAVVIDGVKEAIAAEGDYIKSFAPGTSVKKLGKEHTEADDKKVNLVESFKRTGLSEAEAKIAANIQ